MNNYCVLCGNSNNLLFNLKETTSKYSNKQLIKFVGSRIEDFVFNSHCNICDECNNLINELDSIELRAKEIRNKFHIFLKNNKYGGENSFEVSVNISKNSETFFESNFSNTTVLADSCHYNTEILQTVHKPPENVYNYFNTELQGKSDAVRTDEANNVPPELINLPEDNVFKSSEDTYNYTDTKLEIKNEALNIGEAAPLELVPEDLDDKPRRKGRKKKPVNNAKVYKCDECSKEFPTVSKLKNHSLSHSDHRPYVCEICGQAYKHQFAFQVHVGMHNGVHPFTCVYCKKSFTQKIALMRHVPIHTGEKPFQCDLCGKRFVHHSSFSVHKLSHTGERPFKCDLCGLTLLSASHLKRHLRIHSGEKKYACAICDRRFTERYNLVVHEKLHKNVTSSLDEKKKYRCLICNSTFEREVKLEEHLVHGHQKVQVDLKPFQTV